MQRAVSGCQVATRRAHTNFIAIDWFVVTLTPVECQIAAETVVRRRQGNTKKLWIAVTEMKSHYTAATDEHG